MKNRITAVVVADSINTYGDRITTLELTYPRSVHAEFMTHRMLSKNAASSRAIPYSKLKSAVLGETFYPLGYQKQHPGMQGTEYLSEGVGMTADAIIDEMLRETIRFCDELHDLGITKQVVNRYLEPYQYYKVLATATEWDNFIGLRAHKDAEIHIADLASKVLVALNTSVPKLLQPGDWHLPYGDTYDTVALEKAAFELGIDIMDLTIAVAVARCARVSYNNFNGSAHDYLKDYELFTKLFLNQPIHASPAEHVAYAMSENEYISNVRGELDIDLYDGQYIVDIESNRDKMGYCRNLRGFIQYRTLLENDTIWDDSRLIKKG